MHKHPPSVLGIRGFVTKRAGSGRFQTMIVRKSVWVMPFAAAADYVHVALAPYWYSELCRERGIASLIRVEDSFFFKKKSTHTYHV